MDFTSPSYNLGIDRSEAQPPINLVPVAFSFPAGPVPMMAQPNVDGRKAVNFVEPIVQRTSKKISPSLDEAYSRIEQDALNTRSLYNQGQPSPDAPDVLVYEDVVRSATPSFVRHAREPSIGG
ncbi:hypothetical protein ZWY2020_008653 [Hordeum vulgare]|nr:hypothetical protein ZWY2020_008653 [Hordeum vulgare]